MNGSTVRQFLGIKINHVVEVNFENFPKLIDAMGGIDYTGGCVVSKINGGFKYQPPAGGMGPVSFPGDHVKPTPCAALVKIANAKFEVVSPFACYSSIPFTA